MIAALVLAFVPLVWPVPIEAKPFPTRPAQPTVVSISLALWQSTPPTGVDNPFVEPFGLLENGNARPITATVIDVVTDSCGQSGGWAWPRVYNLAPYQSVTAGNFLALPANFCPGWGYVERVVLVNDEVPMMHYLACAAAGLRPGCGARLDVPVWVEP